ncbi:MAG: HK97 family phage prohead protease, partial [Planctomycetota bacterium]
MKQRKHILPDGQLSTEPVAQSRTFGFAEHRVLGVDEEARTIEAVVSTAALDSYRESVLPEAFAKRLPDRFNKNAPLIAGHVYHAEDGTPGKIGEWIEMGVRKVPDIGMALVGKVKVFDDSTDLARNCWNVMRQSQSIAFSVGWLTHASELQDRTIDGAPQSVRVYTDVELIEVSFVTVPANPEAVVQARIAAQRDTANPDG